MSIKPKFCLYQLESPELGLQSKLFALKPKSIFDSQLEAEDCLEDLFLKDTKGFSYVVLPVFCSHF